ncbi:hypothetical protein GCM10018793_62400 [Streptomyces sulfonofaciens]|uniref:CHAD domain-containing protein n=1 Tax=Streptomyces sulfonofaciens TaxID=68272 RepID=A0A919GME3_9ACTN|nr:CYTH and CHAD domain-containing protein [Streptomyces sulfonofaciens]GHH87263.1 hypothetical protein GCM10018793_62400 [Streptomyces sulfonofaciens]
MAETKREIERKYEGPTEGFDLTRLTRVARVASVEDKGLVELDAVYYDTPDQRLAADRITLRRRTGGTDAGWHLKLPVALEEGVREEVRTPLRDAPGNGAPAARRAGSAARAATGGNPEAPDARAEAPPEAPHEAPHEGSPEAPHEAPPEAPPEELVALVRSRVRDAPLGPVVRLRSARRLGHLLDATGTLLAELSIDGVRAERLGGRPAGTGANGTARGGAGPATAAWTEAEVELADGVAPEFLDEVEEELRKAGWRLSDAPSKLARALAETAGPGTAAPGEAPAAGAGGTTCTAHGRAAPEHAEGPEAPERGEEPAARQRAGQERTARQRTGQDRVGRDRAAPAAEPVLDYLRTQRDALVELDPAVRRDLPDSVHRMRVATRRMRSVLRSYRAVLDRRATAPAADELKWLAGELGADRDREVLVERISAALDHLPPESAAGTARGRLDNWSDRSHGDSRRRLIGVLDSERYLRLLTALDRLLADPPLLEAAAKSPEKVLAKAVRRDRRRLGGRLEKALRRPPGTSRDMALHEARKAAKRLRYTAEAARPVLGRRAKKAVSRAKGLQKLLGDHQDSVMARATLRALAEEAHTAGENAFPYGVLYAREERHAAEDEARLAAREG